MTVPPITERSRDYLAAPRDGGEIELRYIREQADFYYAALKDDPLFEIVPACVKCASDDLRDDRVNFALICNRCGAANAAERLVAGRIARR